MKRYTVMRWIGLGTLIALLLTAGIGPRIPARAQAPTTVTLSPLTLAPGESGAVVGAIVCGAAGCGGFSVTIRFDPAVIRVDAASAGPYLGERVFVGENVIDNDAGSVRLVAAALGDPPAADAALFRLDVTALADGMAVLSIAALEVADLDGQPLPARGIGSVVTVAAPRAPTPTPPAIPAAPALPALIAFVSERGGNPDIYVMNTDGSGLARLTDDPAADISPAWSPDGTRIAFVSERGGSADIYVMNADGRGLARLTDDPAPDLYPAWSPDGQWLAFTSTRDANTDIYVVSATNASDPRRLTFHPAADLMPTWSPNGVWLAFTSGRDGASELYVLEIGETDVVRLTNSQGTHNWFPAWSPDDARISFVVERSGRGEIYTIQPNGAHIRRLSQQPDSVGKTAWSPDGTEIAFVSERDGSADIYVMDAAGANARRLTTDPAPDYDPSWRPAEGPCLVWAERADVAIRVGPGVERGLFGYLPTGQSFFATGQAADTTGARWWRIDKTQLTASDQIDSLWIAQADVLMYGGCGRVGFVDAPPVLYGEPSGPASTPTGSGLWGVCGSCDSCGPYPVGECVLSPEGACIWDPGRCHFIPSGDTSGSGSGCYTVTAGVSPGECGSVTISPAPTCSGGYTPGSSVQLHAEAASGCTFQFWSGTCPGAFGSGDTVLITVSGNCSATAHFRP